MKMRLHLKYYVFKGCIVWIVLVAIAVIAGCDNGVVARRAENCTPLQKMEACFKYDPVKHELRATGTEEIEIGSVRLRENIVSIAPLSYRVVVIESSSNKYLVKFNEAVVAEANSCEGAWEAAHNTFRQYARAFMEAACEPMPDASTKPAK